MKSRQRDGQHGKRKWEINEKKVLTRSRRRGNIKKLSRDRPDRKISGEVHWKLNSWKANKTRWETQRLKNQSADKKSKSFFGPPARERVDGKRRKQVREWAKSKLKRYDGEFDPGSGRTLAACLTHASRTELLFRSSSEWKDKNLVADGWVTRG